MAKIIQAIDGIREAEFTWTFRMGEDGKKTLTGRFVGSPETISKMALSLNFAGGFQPPKDWPAPEGKTWALTQAEASRENMIEAQLAVTFVLVDYGSGGSGPEGSVDENREETADVQNIEKPLTAAPFWTFNSEADVKKGQAAKIAQLYIDAESVDEAEKMLAETAAKKSIDADGVAAIRKFIEKRLAGVEGFYYPAPTLSVKTESATAPDDFGVEVAKIVSKPDISKIPVPNGFEWLGGGDRLRYSGGVFIRERTYIGADSWDRDLYKEKGGE
jgi:hypothetical protein